MIYFLFLVKWYISVQNASVTSLSSEESAHKASRSSAMAPIQFILTEAVQLCISLFLEQSSDESHNWHMSNLLVSGVRGSTYLDSSANPHHKSNRQHLNKWVMWIRIGYATQKSCRVYTCLYTCLYLNLHENCQHRGLKLSSNVGLSQFFFGTPFHPMVASNVTYLPMAIWWRAIPQILICNGTRI